MSTIRLVRRLAAPRSRVYRALTNEQEVAAWMFPAGMTIQVHAFEPRIGGAFRISLTYDAPARVGKTSANTDTYHGRFVELSPHRRVVQVMEFETGDASMAGEMTVSFDLRDAAGGTELAATHENVPPGVRPEDNEAGWRQSLARLAALVERRGPDSRA